MTVSVCLLRGINVGGRNSLPMAHLREIFSGLGVVDVKTYIQSGNAVFRGTLTTEAIQEAIAQKTALRPQILLFSLTEYRAILNENPFQPPDSSHVLFLASPPREIGSEVLALAGAREAVHETDQATYLNAPDGIGRSKLAAKLESALGVPATMRNWRSCLKIRDLAQGIV